MARYFSIYAFFVLIALFSLGCSNRPDSQVNPVLPDVRASVSKGANNVLLGYYDIYIDLPSKTATAVLNRQVMFSLNLVNMLNKNPGSLKLHILETPVSPDYVDVDLDVTITHPFAGMHQYDAYDVRAIFIGDGSGMIQYNSDLQYSVLGTDQFMLDDPDDDDGGGPDGYTRWFNNTEFSMGGPPFLQYVKGKFSAKDYEGTATLCPYKYYADGLTAKGDLWDWLAANPDSHGVFSAGSKNTRNFYIRFPFQPVMKWGKFAYAVVANWQGPEPEDHPSNAPEAIACSVNVTPDLFINGKCVPDAGGDLIADVSLFGWKKRPSQIYIESTVLSYTYELSPAEMTPIGGSENYSTYHFEVESDNLQSQYGNEFWIIAEYIDCNYKNPFDIPNLAGNDPLIAAFRYDLWVANAGYCPPVYVYDITGLEGQPSGTEQAKKGQTYEDALITGEGFYGPPDIVKFYNHDIDWINFEADEVIFFDDMTLDFTITIPESVDTGLYDVYVESCCGLYGYGYNMVEVID